MFDFKDKKVTCFMTCNENKQYIFDLVKSTNI